MKAPSAEGCVTFVILIGFLGFIAVVALEPYFESRAYNRLTGAHATYWDALWLDLRVQKEPK